MALSIEVTRRRFTASEYHRMAEVGILTERDRVELIEGEIVQMTPIGRRHAACVAALAELLVRRLGPRGKLWPQNPITLPNDTEPQPDIVVLRPRADGYARDEARPEDVRLVIEVADTSYRYDRDVKLPLYARAGIAEAWIVDIPGDAVEVHRNPSSTGYTTTERIGRGRTVAPEAFPDVQLSVDDILVVPA